MRKRLAYRHMLASCCGLGIVAGTMPGVALAAPAPAVRVGSASFDAAHQSLTIPFDGALPNVQVRRLAPHQYVADISHAALFRSEVQGQYAASPEVAGWTLDDTPQGDVVRLRLTLNSDLAPRVRVCQGYVTVDVLTAGPVHPSLAAAVKRETPVLPAIVTHHTAGTTPAVHANKPLKFPVATAVPHAHLWGPLPAGARRADGPVVVATLPAAPRRVATHHAHPLPHLASHPLVASRASALVAGNKTYPLLLSDRKLPATSEAYAPRVPAGLAFPAVAAAPTIQPLQSRAHNGVATLGAAHFDHKLGCLVIPVDGAIDPTKLGVVRLNSRWSYLDVPGSHPSFGGVRYHERADKTFQRWVMAKRPNRNTTRVSLALGAPAEVAVKLEGQQLLISVKSDTVMLGHKPATKVVPPANLAFTATPAETATAQVAAKPVVEAAKPVVLPVKPVAKATKPVVKPIALVHAPVPVPGAATTLGRPYFDQGKYGLVVPYQGATPLYRWDRRGETAASLEIKGAVTTVGGLAQSFRNHPVMSRWQMAGNKAAGTVRLDLGFSQPADVVIAADPAHHQLMLIPQPKLAGDEGTTAAKTTTTLAAVKLPADGRHLFIPFDGPVPAYSLAQVGNSFAYVDFPGTRLADRAVEFFAPEYHPTLDYWLMTERADRGVRLALALTQAGAPAVFEDRTNQRLVIELGDDHPVLGARSQPRLPAPWPGEQHPTGYKPPSPAIEIGRKAS